MNELYTLKIPAGLYVMNSTQFVEISIFHLTLLYYLCQKHNCVKELRELISSQSLKLTVMEAHLAESRLAVTELKKEIQLLKVCIFSKKNFPLS